MASERQYFVTEEGLAALEKELEELKTVGRREVAEKIKVALSFGDLSENFEYYCAKRDNNQNNSRIRYLEKMLRFATVVDESPDEDTVGINNTVDIYYEEDDETEEYRIVTPIRCDPKKRLISNESPLGSALIGRRKGDRVSICVDGGESYTVVIRSIEKTGESDSDVMHSF